MFPEHSPYRCVNGADAPMPAKLADESAARAQGAMHASGDPVGARHPVHGGVRKHGVEFIAECQRLAVHDTDIEAPGPCRGDHRLGTVDAEHGHACRAQTIGQRAVAAAKIEDAFAGFRIEPGQHFFAEGRDEGGMLLIPFRRPGLFGH